MCQPSHALPDIIPVQRIPVDAERERYLYVPALAKRVEKVFNRHVSARDRTFEYPLSRWVYDANCIVGDHDRCIHLMPTAREAQRLSGYGDHTLLVLPGRAYWGREHELGWCHHTNGAFTLICLECEGYQPYHVSLREFWDAEVPRGLMDLVRDAARQGAFVGSIIVRRA
jgi:hypothetical protein